MTSTRTPVDDIGVDEEPDLLLRRCPDCNSERPDLKCWKCGADTFESHPQWRNLKLPSIDQIKQLGREVGYCIAVHGSLQRDLDIVAAPWTEDAVSMEDLIAHLNAGLGSRVVGPIEQKPLGRVAVNLQLNGWFKLIDLSICPRIKTSTTE